MNIHSFFPQCVCGQHAYLSEDDIEVCYIENFIRAYIQLSRCFHCDREGVYVTHGSTGANIYSIAHEPDWEFDIDEVHEYIISELSAYWNAYDERLTRARSALEKQFFNRFCGERGIVGADKKQFSSQLQEQYISAFTAFCISPVYTYALGKEYVPIPKVILSECNAYVNISDSRTPAWKKIKEHSCFND